jgi:transcriptional regulator with XRE-family HTH domain
MGKASQALKQVLEQYGISQNRLAVALQIDRSAVFKWFHEQREPTSETIVEITKALKGMNPTAAKEFVRLYLGEIVEEDDR